MNLEDRFLVPPFSVIDARSGLWQTRKKNWIDIGIKREEGRGKNLLHFSETTLRLTGITATTSIFDPFLAELMISWFCPQHGQIVDPFAGGSVRGIVAGSLGRRYWGCDLRQEQIDANRLQAAKIVPEVTPEWVCGDSQDKLASAPEADFVFSCPPYGDLEQYSDDPRDLSNMAWVDFKSAYDRIISLTVARLKPNRFACFVVGDFRDKRGFYRGFVSATASAFAAAGAELYNEAILLNITGSAGLRATRIFSASRKMVKVHQNVLVFCKGDPFAATKVCGHIYPIDLGDQLTLI